MMKLENILKAGIAGAMGLASLMPINAEATTNEYQNPEAIHASLVPIGGRVLYDIVHEDSNNTYGVVIYDTEQNEIFSNGDSALYVKGDFDSGTLNEISQYFRRGLPIPEGIAQYLSEAVMVQNTTDHGIVISDYLTGDLRHNNPNGEYIENMVDETVIYLYFQRNGPNNSAI